MFLLWFGLQWNTRRSYLGRQAHSTEQLGCSSLAERSIGQALQCCGQAFESLLDVWAGVGRQNAVGHSIF